MTRTKGTNEGLVHCNTLHRWADLLYTIDEQAQTWTWLCPLCLFVVQVDPYSPPADLPTLPAQEAPSQPQEGVQKALYVVSEG